MINRNMDNRLNPARIERVTRQSAKGRFRCQVLDAETMRVVRDHGWQKNLILDQGLNQVASYAWCDLFLVAAIGTGNTPTEDDSGASTANQSGTTVTIDSGPFVFALTDEDDLIRWDSGEEAKIVSYTDPTHVEVSNSATVGSGEFTIYRVSQTGLDTEIKRSINTSTDQPKYVTGSGNCGSTLVGNTLTSKRTWDFPTESGSATYRELGVSYSGVGGNNLFSRVVLDTPVGLTAGQILRLSYELSVTMTPNTPQAATASIGGWPIAPSVTTDGDQQWQRIGLSSVNTSGTTEPYDGGGYCNEPAFAAGTSFSVPTGAAVAPFTTNYSVNGAVVFLSNVASAPASFGGSVNRSTERATKNSALGSFSAGVWTRTKSCTFGLTEANRVDWRSMGIGPSDSAPGVDHNATVDSGFVFVFDEFQTKLSTHTLALVFRYTWGRDLS